MAIEYANGPVPWTDFNGRRGLTGLQLMQDPALMQFVERYEAHFEMHPEADIWLWKGKADG